ncbi:MAG: FAD:protein FMN transferase, partial [Bacteroidales bacterium]
MIKNIKPLVWNLIFTLLFFCSCKTDNKYTRLTGFVQGTSYTIIYQGADNLQDEIEQLLAKFDSSLSVYNPQSIISKVNRNEDVELDSFFINCIQLAQQAS